eukprot:jgi/Hompol1/3780/HPOL_003351-RA
MGLLEEARLGDLIGDYQHKLGVEIQLRSSAQVMFNSHSDKQARRNAELEIQLCHHRIETISNDLLITLAHFREVSTLLRDAEVAAVRAEFESMFGSLSTSTVQTVNAPALPPKETKDCSRSTLELYRPSRNHSSPGRSTTLLNTLYSNSFDVYDTSADHSIITSHPHPSQHHSRSLSDLSSFFRRRASPTPATKNPPPSMLHPSILELLNAKDREIMSLKHNLDMTMKQLISSADHVKPSAHSAVIASDSMKHDLSLNLDNPEQKQREDSATVTSTSDYRNSVSQTTTSRDSVDLETRIQTLQSSFNELRRQHNNVVKENQVLRNRLVELGIDIGHIGATTDCADTQLQEHLETISRERDELKKLLANVSSKHQHFVDGIADWKKTLVADLGAKLASVEASLTLVRSTEKAKQDSMQSEIDALIVERDSIKAANSSDAAKLAETTLAFEQQIAELQKQLSTQEALLQEKDDNLKKLGDDLASLQTELEHHKNTASDAIETSKNLKTRNDELNLKVDSLCTSITLLKNQRASIETAIGTLEAKNSELDSQILQMSRCLAEAHANEESTVDSARKIQAANEAEIQRLQTALDKHQLDLRLSRHKELELMDTIAALESNLSHISSETDSHRLKIERITSEYESRVQQLSADAATLKNQIATLVQERDVLRVRCGELTKDYQSLIDSHESLKAAYNESLEVRRELESQVHSHAAKIDELQEAHTASKLDLERAHLHANDLETKLKSSYDDQDKLKQSHRDIAEQLNTATRLKMQLESDLEQVKRELVTARSECDQNKNQAQTIELECTRLSVQLKSFKALAEQSMQQCRALESELSSSQAIMSRLISSDEQGQRDHAALQSAFANICQERSDLLDRMRKLQVEAENSKTLKSQLADAESLLQRSQELSSERANRVDMLQARIAELELEQASTRAGFDHVVAEHSAIIANHRNAAESLQKRLSDLSAELTIAEKQTSSAKAELLVQTTTIAQLTADLSKATKSADDLKATILSMEASLAKERSESATCLEVALLEKSVAVAEIEQMRSQLMQLTDQRNALKQHYDSNITALSEKQATIDACSQQIATLVEHLESERATNAATSEASVRLTQLEQDLKSRVAECQSLMEQVAQHDQERARVSMELEETKKALNSLSLADTHANNDRNSSELEMLHAELTQRQATLTHLASCKISLEAQLREVTAQRDSHFSRVVDLERQLDELTWRVKQSETIDDDLRRRVQDLEHECTQMSADRAELLRKCADLESLFDIKQKELRDVSHRHENALAALQTKLDEAQHRIQDLLGDLAESNSRLVTIETERARIVNDATAVEQSLRNELDATLQTLSRRVDQVRQLESEILRLKEVYREHMALTKTAQDISCLLDQLDRAKAEFKTLASNHMDLSTTLIQTVSDFDGLRIVQRLDSPETPTPVSLPSP